MMPKASYIEALLYSRVLEVLRPFDPHVCGTAPLALSVPGSDIDILCQAPEPDLFAAVLRERFGNTLDFALRQETDRGRPVIARFTAWGWPFEIFGAAEPVRDQPRWRHFSMERRLLALGGEVLRAAVMRHRMAGMNTEPAFTAALGLKGDPDAALLALEDLTDAELVEIVTSAGFERADLLAAE